MFSDHAQDHVGIGQELRSPGRSSRRSRLQHGDGQDRHRDAQLHGLVDQGQIVRQREGIPEYDARWSDARQHGDGLGRAGRFVYEMAIGLEQATNGASDVFLIFYDKHGHRHEEKVSAAGRVAKMGGSRQTIRREIRVLLSHDRLWSGIQVPMIVESRGDRAYLIVSRIRASAATTSRNSAGSTGLGTNIWKPAFSAWRRSSARA